MEREVPPLFSRMSQLGVNDRRRRWVDQRFRLKSSLKSRPDWKDEHEPSLCYHRT
jgi:hypothetical protein